MADKPSKREEPHKRIKGVGKSVLHTHVSTRGKVWPEGLYKQRKEYFLV